MTHTTNNQDYPTSRAIEERYSTLSLDTEAMTLNSLLNFTPSDTITSQEQHSNRVPFSKSSSSAPSPYHHHHETQQLQQKDQTQKFQQHCEIITQEQEPEAEAEDWLYEQHAQHTVSQCIDSLFSTNHSRSEDEHAIQKHMEQQQPFAYHLLSQVPPYLNQCNIVHSRIQKLFHDDASVKLNNQPSSPLSSDHHDVVVVGSCHYNNSLSSSSSSPTATDNHKYKTELCRSYFETGHCRYGKKCKFAHGRQELKTVVRHSKFKSELCYNYHYCVTCVCPYGVRCCFLHEIPLEFLGKAVAENIDSVLLYQSNLRLKAFTELCEHKEEPVAVSEIMKNRAKEPSLGTRWKKNENQGLYHRA